MARFSKIGGREAEQPRGPDRHGPKDPRGQAPRAIDRLCELLKLSKDSDVDRVCDEAANHIEDLRTFIDGEGLQAKFHNTVFVRR